MVCITQKRFISYAVHKEQVRCKHNIAFGSQSSNGMQELFWSYNTTIVIIKHTKSYFFDLEHFKPRFKSLSRRSNRPNKMIDQWHIRCLVTPLIPRQVHKRDLSKLPDTLYNCLNSKAVVYIFIKQYPRPYKYKWRLQWEARKTRP